jgi:hypothetical protein
VSWLHANELITNPSGFSVVLLDPRTQTPYRTESPVELDLRIKRRSKFKEIIGPKNLRNTALWEGSPLDLPAAWWRNGWISSLTGVELALLLMMWDVTRGASDPFRIRRIRKSQYGLKKGCVQRGRAGLESLNLLEAHKVGTVGKAIDYEYRVDWSALLATPKSRSPEKLSIQG